MSAVAPPPPAHCHAALWAAAGRRYASPPAPPRAAAVLSVQQDSDGGIDGEEDSEDYLIIGHGPGGTAAPIYGDHLTILDDLALTPEQVCGHAGEWDGADARPDDPLVGGSDVSGGWCARVSECMCDAELRTLLSLAAPAGLQALFDNTTTLVSTAMLGHLVGTDALAAGAVSCAWMMITITFPFSVSNCLNTLCSQAYGAGNLALVGKWLQVGLVVFTALAAPVFVVWWGATARFVHAVGSDAHVAALAQRYARYSIPGWYVSGVQYCVTQYYESFGVINQAMLITLAFIPVNVGLAYLLIEGVGGWPGLGFDGSPLASSIARVCQAAVFIVYCAYRGLHKETWPGWTLDSFKPGRVKEYLKQGVPQAVGSVAEEGQFQLLTVFVVHLGTVPLAAWSALGNVWGVFIATAFGACKAINLRVSYHLGAASAATARKAMRQGTACICIASVVAAALQVLFREYIGRVFSSDPALVAKIAALCWLQALALVTCSPGVAAFFILDAQGRPHLGALGAGLGAWVLNVPLAAVAVFKLHWGVEGLLGSIVVGYTIICASLWTIVLRSPWERLVGEARRRSEVAAPHAAAGRGAGAPAVDAAADAAHATPARPTPSATVSCG